MTQGDDVRLDRLYDYTKFHIGIYITGGGALLALYGSKDYQIFGAALQSHAWLVRTSILFIFIAGLSGGIIASSCTVAKSFDELWNERIGPLKLRVLQGSQWAGLEHSAFWLSAVLIGLAIVWK